MKVIPPITITDGILTSSTVSEPDTGEVAWNPATAYSLGDTAYLASNHTVYERIIAGTTATSPDEDTTNWAATGKTNKWQMFDLFRNQQTTAASPLTVVITPGERIDSLVLSGMENVNTIRITVTSVTGGGTVYDLTTELDTREVLSYWDYFFKPFTTKSSVAFFEIPPYSDAVMTVIFTANSGNVSIGSFVIGRKQFIGNVRPSAVADVINFSTVDRDEFGNSELVQRRNVPKTINEIIVEKGYVNAIRAIRDDLNAVPAAWVGMDNSDHEYYESILIMGIYKKFSISLDHPNYAVISLELEEV